ncbi:hypothetical protein ACIQTW_21590 [Paenarthrobacter sp. NPDC090517]|uniref:hypothetical protein n=1 Tax=Paenarthrobacter sp. NPDC090517 TaxID=3364381 RepID=UPI00380EE466
MEALTFEEARTTVRESRESLWEGLGTYTVADYGWEDETSYLVVEGAREYLEDNNDEFVVMDAPAIFVDKATGIVLEADFLAVAGRVQAMTPVPGHEYRDAG